MLLNDSDIINSIVIEFLPDKDKKKIEDKKPAQKADSKTLKKRGYFALSSIVSSARASASTNTRPSRTC